MSDSISAISTSIKTVGENNQMAVKEMKCQINKMKSLEEEILLANTMAENSLNSAMELTEIAKRLDGLGMELKQALSMNKK